MAIYVCTMWKARALSPEQLNRMMHVWAKLEAYTASSTSVERVCWYIFSDSSGGFTVSKVLDVETAGAFELEQRLALSEFLELESKVLLDLDTAMPAILKGVAHVSS